MRRVAPTAAFLAFLAAGPPGADAQGGEGGPATPDRCVDLAAGALGPGSSVLQRGGPAFLVPGETTVVEVAPSPTHPCVAVLALSHRGSTDVDGQLLTDTGILLVEDVAPVGHALLLHCGAGALALRAAFRVASGAGEVFWAAIGTSLNAPPRLDRLPGGCFSGGPGVAVTPPEVGEEPEVDSDAAARARIEDLLTQRGYTEVRSPVVRDVRPREQVPVSFPTQPGACYAAMGTAIGGIADVDLLVRDSRGRVVAGEDSPSPSGAVVEWCAPEGGLHEVTAIGYGTPGRITIRTLVYRPPSGVPRSPVDVRGAGAVAFTELASHLTERGLVPVARRWGSIAADGVWSIPVDLPPGRCHALGAVPADGGARTRLRGVLLDAEGRVLAEDIAVGAPLRLHHCPPSPGRLRLEISLVGRPTPVLFVLATRPGPEGDAPLPSKRKDQP